MAESQKKTVLCPNPKCKREIDSEKLKSHTKKECDYAVISCKYENIGCTKKLEKKDMRTHEKDDSVHLRAALDTLRKRDDEIILKKAEPYIFKVTNFEERKESHEVMYKSFYTGSEGYHMIVEVYPCGPSTSHISLYIGCKEGRNDQNLAWPFAGKVTFELLNQLADEKHCDKTISIEAKDAVTATSEHLVGVNSFLTHDELPFNHTHNTQYLKNDILYFRVTVKIPDYKPWVECTTR